jgi:hypothetical protein
MTLGAYEHAPHSRNMLLEMYFLRERFSYMGWKAVHDHQDFGVFLLFQNEVVMIERGDYI